MLASIGPLTSGCILCAHSCCNYPLSCRGVGGEALSSVSPLQRYGTKMAESDLWWLIVTYGDLEWNKTKNMLCPSDYLRRPPTRLWEMLYILRVNLSNLCHLWAMNRFTVRKKLYISVCALPGGKSSYCQGSFLAWNQPWTWMNRRMTICQHLTGDVRTEKWTKNIRGQGAVCQNNILNINLMYSRNLAHLFSKTVRLSLKCQPSCSIEISLHCCPPPLTD